ncbi:CUE domain-containing protein, variant 2 [Blastomyces dermatitidis ER-3]|nr:CUE domain-containing protein [Blastomyces dermatitidis ER-3]XP_045279377.1 CUE domain-containing protein, variant 1 [Blastomyces dermatitidis ER-3]XP_045279378.1 CUE domain-containing protein, variant 2 [Blastomyces dermatitidis ER-3]OAS99648.1 CUE domain-containing protein [Blastomyces dermatitidis ER-3]OAS99649.1 CUE domain-containing protein, variant 1 [Blastomyces dermatitidis ER-3]OAS99650.1 CUE domain-containing protein, variant 2 [Blastomyces dermatitidis ER-3]
MKKKVRRMDKFLSRKRPRDSSPPESHKETTFLSANDGDCEIAKDEESTDVKLAILASLFPDFQQEFLLDVLVASEGSLTAACSTLPSQTPPSGNKKRNISSGLGIQSSLSSFGVTATNLSTSKAGPKALTKRGRTLHLFSPEDISKYTPCTIIHNFLAAEEANDLLRELLEEAKTFHRQTFQLFESTVQSPHSAGFYVSSTEELHKHKHEYSYNGTYRTDVRQLTPELRRVSTKVQKAVNDEIHKRITSHYPGGKKLKYQSSRTWVPNAAFVNCYDGPSESVGYHSDELTYLGPRPVIGSLSLGVTREFRVRRIVPPDDPEGPNANGNDSNANANEETIATQTSTSTSISTTTTAAAATRADIQGQISIHLPHNSLLVMHAETQEEYKHSISPAQTISPHPIAGNKRINITYRWYRESLHPRHTPKCRCGMPCVLRCVQRKRDTRGRYMWMCYAGYAVGKTSCSFFQWAEFDDEGEPIWRNGVGKERGK